MSKIESVGGTAEPDDHNPPREPESRIGTTDTLPSRRLSSLKFFWSNALVLLLLLFGGAAIVNNGSISVPDDGVYAAQLRLLDQGTWSMKRPAAGVDADGLNSAISPSDAFGDSQIPYSRHPVFSVSLVPFYRAGGFGGLMVYSALGAWGAAIAAGLLARRLDQTYGVPAFWLIGIGSPLIFDAFLVSALSMAAAAAGFALLGLSQALDDKASRPLLYALPCVMLAVNLRSEAAIVMAMTGGVIGLISLYQTVRPTLNRRRCEWRGVAIGGSVLIAGAIGYVIDAWWTRVITARAGVEDIPLVRTLGEYTGPLSAMWSSLFRPWDGSFVNAQVSIALTFIAVVLAGMFLKISPKRWLLPLSLLAMSTFALVIRQFGDQGLITGLFAAFPVLLSGLILLKRSDFVDPLIKRLLAIGALSTVGLVMTIYSIGGAAEWGGRFFHILLPLLAPLVIVGLDRGRRSLPARIGILAAVFVVIISLSMSVFAVRFLYDSRRWTRALVESTLVTANEWSRANLDRSSNENYLVIIGRFGSDGIARAFWEPSSGIDIVAARGIGDVYRVIHRAEAAGYESVALVSDTDELTLQIVGAKQVKEGSWGITEAATLDGTGMRIYRFGPKPNH